MICITYMWRLEASFEGNVHRISLMLNALFNDHIWDQVGRLIAYFIFRNGLFCIIVIGILATFNFFLKILAIRLLSAFPTSMVACNIRFCLFCSSRCSSLDFVLCLQSHHALSSYLFNQDRCLNPIITCKVGAIRCRAFLLQIQVSAIQSSNLVQ